MISLSISHTWKLVTAKQLDEAANPMGTVSGSQKKEWLSPLLMKESKIDPDLQKALVSPVKTLRKRAC